MNAEKGAVRTRRRGGFRTSIALVLIVAALGALPFAYAGLYKSLYSPSAFVADYLALLSQGRAADALQVPGVAIDSADLEEAGLASNASDAMLRRAALTSLTDYRITHEETRNNVTYVTVSYLAGGHQGRSTFEVASAGWEGLVPTWRFARTPLSIIDLSVNGSSEFAVNGFTVDRRQLSATGTAENADNATPLLVFTPGLYNIDVKTPLATSSGTAVLADMPLKEVNVNVDAKATKEFIDTVQSRVSDFLAECTKQDVLLPAGCPFGLEVQNRISSTPKWTITNEPKVTLRPTKDGWMIPVAQGTAHIEVEIQLISTGEYVERSQDVQFALSGKIEILPDGRASISLESPIE